MQGMTLNIYVQALSMKNVLKNEEGQDLVEYALVVALLSFAAIVGMNSLAAGINLAFSDIATKFTAATA